MPINGAPHIRYIIVHSPGPSWEKGKDFREQAGVEGHVMHYRAVHAAGQLQLGGPFLLPDSGGMMIPVEGLSELEVRRIAETDPAVLSGLLKAEVRPWYVAMSSTS